MTTKPRSDKMVDIGYEDFKLSGDPRRHLEYISGHGRTWVRAGDVFGRYTCPTETFLKNYINELLSEQAESVPDAGPNCKDPAYWTETTPAVKFARTRLQDFLAKKQEGDDLCVFSTDDGSWKSHSGRMGYLILRGDMVVSAYVVCMN